jgi:hypothetical protein
MHGKTMTVLCKASILAVFLINSSDVKLASAPLVFVETGPRIAHFTIFSFFFDFFKPKMSEKEKNIERIR